MSTGMPFRTAPKHPPTGAEPSYRAASGDRSGPITILRPEGSAPAEVAAEVIKMQ
jgi:hypothetical protein